MTVTVVGCLLDRLGQAHQRSFVCNRHGAWETRRRLWATPSSEVRRRQAPFIGIDLAHSHDWIGQVIHLELGPDEKVWAVAHVSGFVPPEQPLFWSPTLVCNEHDYGDVEISSLAIVQHPAQTGIRHSPLQFLEGACDYRGAVKRWPKSELDGYRRDICERACSTYVLRERSAPLIVAESDLAQRDLDRRLSPSETYLALTEQYDEAWQSRPLRWRPSHILSVR